MHCIARSIIYCNKINIGLFAGDVHVHVGLIGRESGLCFIPTRNHKVVNLVPLKKRIPLYKILAESMTVYERNLSFGDVEGKGGSQVPQPLEKREMGMVIYYNTLLSLLLDCCGLHVCTHICDHWLMFTETWVCLLPFIVCPHCPLHRQTDRH